MVSNVSRVWKPDETLTLVFEILHENYQHNGHRHLVPKYKSFLEPFWQMAAGDEIKNMMY